MPSGVSQLTGAGPAWGAPSHLGELRKMQVASATVWHSAEVTQTEGGVPWLPTHRDRSASLRGRHHVGRQDLRGVDSLTDLLLDEMHS